jgi:hypothetical protein
MSCLSVAPEYVELFLETKLAVYVLISCEI